MAMLLIIPVWIVLLALVGALRGAARRGEIAIDAPPLEDAPVVAAAERGGLEENPRWVEETARERVAGAGRIELAA